MQQIGQLYNVMAWCWSAPGHDTRTYQLDLCVHYDCIFRKYTITWRYNERDGFSNRRRLDWLLNRLFKSISKKRWKLLVTGLWDGNSAVLGEFPTQRASNTENVSIWWRHHEWNTMRVTIVYSLSFKCFYTGSCSIHMYWLQWKIVYINVWARLFYTRTLKPIIKI